MKIHSKLTYCFVGLLATAVMATANADPAIVVVSNKQQQATPGLQVAVDLLNDLLQIDQIITVRIDADDGPLYDPETNEIWMPNTFTNEISQRFNQSGLSEDDEHSIQITHDVLMHTLIHEVGHALVALYELPILGREEDAVDALANVIMLEYLQDGADATLNAADMFGLESEDRDTFDEDDFWDSHSLDIQRYYATVCHVYGSAPEEQNALIESELLSEERADECIEEYQQLSQSWFEVLTPYLKDEAQ